MKVKIICISVCDTYTGHFQEYFWIVNPFPSRSKRADITIRKLCFLIFKPSYDN